MSLKKSNLSKTHIQQSVKSKFFKKFKVIAWLPILQKFFLEKRFLRKSSKPGWNGNQVLITWTIQVELFKVELQLWWYKNLFSSRFKGLSTDNFCHAQWILSVKQKKPHAPVPKRQYQDGKNTNPNFLHCVSSFSRYFL